MFLYLVTYQCGTGHWSGIGFQFLAFLLWSLMGVVLWMGSLLAGGFRPCVWSIPFAFLFVAFNGCSVVDGFSCLVLVGLWVWSIPFAFLCL